jgi:hypothetical protein
MMMMVFVLHGLLLLLLLPIRLSFRPNRPPAGRMKRRRRRKGKAIWGMRGKVEGEKS